MDMSRNRDVLDILGLLCCPTFSKGCSVCSSTLYRFSCRDLYCTGDRCGCSFLVVGIFSTYSLCGAAAAVFCPGVGYSIPNMDMRRNWNILNILGLSCRPAFCKGCSVGRSALYRFSCGNLYSTADRCGCSFLVVGIFSTYTLCGTAASVFCPGVGGISPGVRVRTTIVYNGDRGSVISFIRVVVVVRCSQNNHFEANGISAGRSICCHLISRIHILGSVRDLYGSREGVIRPGH